MKATKTKKIIKKSKPRIKDISIELDNAEINLIIEAIRDKRKKVEEDRFYVRCHPEEFYNIYLRRCNDILNKLDIRIPRAVFIKMPKF